MKNLYILLLLGLLFTLGCGDDDDSGSIPIDTTSACSNLVKYCPGGYTWWRYVTDEKECQQAYSCVYKLYSGHCRQLLVDSGNCLADLKDSSGCLDCNDFLSDIESSCAYPKSCIGEMSGD
jgi:hypothetical protein